ncbi:putative hscarg dehydrogenase [Aspergillus filifer]
MPTTTTIKKTIAIIGATGIQGSSVAKSFLSLPNWTVRAITRNASSSSARALASQGCTVVEADLNSIDSLRAAFADAHAIFVNTDFWGPYISDPNRDSDKAFNTEVTHGKNAAIAAAGISTLERYVYSALASMKRGSNGKYARSLHCESKAAVVEYIESDQIELAKKASFIYIGAYATNPLFSPRFDAEGQVYRFTLQIGGSCRMPIIDTGASTGGFVRELVVTESAGLKLLAHDRDSYLSMDEVVQIWERVTGGKAALETVSLSELYAASGVPIEALEAPIAIEEFGYMAGVEEYVLPGDLQNEVPTKSFEEWLAAGDWRSLRAKGVAELASIKNLE